MSDEEEGQQAEKIKVMAEPKAWWKLNPDTRKIFNTVSGAIGTISGIITFAALFVHGNIAILLWSAGVDAAALAAFLLVQLAGGRTLKINFEVKLQRVLMAVSAVVIALGCWGIYAYTSHPGHQVRARPAVSPRTVSIPPSVPPPVSQIPGPTPDPSPISAAPGIRRQGVLKLDDQGTAYDLDSLSRNWRPSSGVRWTFQNIEYLPGTGLAISDEPVTDVLMGAGNWTYQDCVQAHYNPTYSSNPNNIGMNDLKPGREICVHTRNDSVNNPGKTDGGHYVLLRVKEVSLTALTLEVKVWQ